MKRATLLLFTYFLFPLFSFAQETVVIGKVLDRNSKEALPFVSIGFKGTKTGVTTDFEGNFSLRTSEPVDSIIVTYVGYKRYTRAVKRGQSQTMMIELKENSTELSEVIIRPGENPALRIIRKAQENRDLNDQRNLAAYEYDSYSKMDLALNNISEKMKDRKLLRPLRSLFDTANQIRNEEGKYILPVFISETFSRYHYQRDPSRTKEIVKASSSTGIGVTEQSYVTDLLGTSFLQFNFNQNWMRILGKDFISPIAFGSNSYYIYTLEDSVEIDGFKCYKIRLNLRREEDLGFLGTMWITDSSFAIKRINVEISRAANINFIERLKVQQEMQPTTAGPWLPVKTRMVVEIAQISENSSGLIAKLYTANSNMAVNQIRPDDFFENIVEKEPDVFDKDTAFWQSKRPEEFSTIEKQMFTMVDSIRTLPVIKTYVDIIRLLIEGYYRKGKFDFGPYIFTYGYNSVEHSRFRVGFRTNHFFDRHWVLKGYLAYGTADEKFKYSGGVDYIFSKTHWTSAGFNYKYDYDLLGITTDVQQGGVSNLFATANIINPRAKLNETEEYRFNFLTNPKRDWTFRVILQNNYFRPLGDFRFSYLPDEHDTSRIMNSFVNSLATFEVRWAYKEVLVARGNDRMRLVRSRIPIFTLQYARGFKNVLGGDFDYDKVSITMNQHFTMGVLGNSDYSITAGKIFGNLPYPLLEIPRGNQSFIFTDLNFSLMNLYEFASDEYVQVFYTHHFEGLFSNRIPLLKKLKWRNFAAIKSAYGHLGETNRVRNLIGVLPPSYGERFGMDRRLAEVREFTRGPYTEVSVGFENIFHIMSLSYVHRLNYMGPGVRRWGINLGLRIEF